ncbi:oxysterol-binding protein [Acrasis kona]|uniref:Oxysterol-binding protein n=1 Tax=Acrasis kona TaxID=1008807 RepID=A0AAW2ZL21_9EUKA
MPLLLNKVGDDGRFIDALPEGGYPFTDEEDIKKQRKGMWDIMKKLGTNLVEGKDLVSVSLPVYLFEPRSFLQRLTDTWAYYDQYLPIAAKTDDPILRLALVISFGISGLHQTCIAKKPFNPILGETFEAVYTIDNTELFVEQISHHPPITTWEMKGEGYSFTGQAGYQANIRANALKASQLGPNIIRLPKYDTTIIYEQPIVWLKNVMFGSRVMEYYGNMKFEDRASGLTCDVKFNPDEKGFIGRWFGSSKKSPSDTVRGEIKDSYDQVVGTIEGSWLGYVDFTDSASGQTKRLWSIGHNMPNYPQAIPNPLPSDSRFRPDAIALAQEDLELSQQIKEELENKQRREKRLRKGLTE